MLFKIFFIFSCFLIPLCAQEEDRITRYFNGRVIRGHQLHEADLWVYQGKIIAPQVKVDCEIDTMGAIIAPGYIDLQINGGFGYDFTIEPEKASDVARLLPRYGVTAFLPTVISSSSEHYKSILPYMQPRSCAGSASILGIHLEGPFLCKQRNGAHNIEILQSFDQCDIEDFYGSLDSVRIVTLAPKCLMRMKLSLGLKNWESLFQQGTRMLLTMKCKKDLRSVLPLPHIFLIRCHPSIIESLELLALF